MKLIIFQPEIEYAHRVCFFDSESMAKDTYMRVTVIIDTVKLISKFKMSSKRVIPNLRFKFEDEYGPCFANIDSFMPVFKWNRKNLNMSRDDNYYIAIIVIKSKDTGVACKFSQKRMELKFVKISNFPLFLIKNNIYWCEKLMII